MFKPFIPAAAHRLEDQDAIALLQRVHHRPITIPHLVAEGSLTIPTAVITPADSAAIADGPPLLVLHGFDSSLLEFRRLIPHLPSRWPIYGLDLLGSGFTVHAPAVSVEPRTIRQHLYYTWKTLINRPVTLLGASLGGAVAIDFALTYPNCVDRLILIDSVGFSGNFPLGKLLASPLLDWGADWLHLRKDVVFRALDVLPFVDAEQRDLVLCSALHQAMPGWKQSVMSFTKSGGYSYLPQHIGDVQQPTLILWGDRDSSLGTEDASRFERTIPRSRLVWIKDADHVPHLCRPAAVAREIVAQMRGDWSQPA